MLAMAERLGSGGSVRGVGVLLGSRVKVRMGVSVSTVV